MKTHDLSLLLALDALIQEGSVTRAARRVGLSVPAMSQTLKRIRAVLDDPILVRAGRAMVLTPRALALGPEVRSTVEQAQRVLRPQAPFVAAELERTFVVRATDYVLLVLGPTLDRLVGAQAPQANLRFVANALDDPEALRTGAADLAVGIYGDLPPELRIRTLLTDRFVCVLRKDHPLAGRRLTLARYAELPHVQVAPRGRPGGYVDAQLAAHGKRRRVARAVPSFHAALALVASADYVLTISERAARALAPGLGLEVRPPPLELEPYALSLVWHPRLDGDPAHRWLRERFIEAADQAAGDRHPNPRRRLGGGSVRQRR
ncbi:MAG: LysR family transcriptional regulator [Myxococcales bacterium]|nr:LysR family transcriptional regulator [Myxococcales bacterium]